MATLYEALIKERSILSAMTPGDWYLETEPGLTPTLISIQRQDGVIHGTHIAEAIEREEDAQFFLHAHTALPQRNAQLQEILDELEELDRQHNVSSMRDSAYVRGSVYVVERIRQVIENAHRSSLEVAPRSKPAQPSKETSRD